MSSKLCRGLKCCLLAGALFAPAIVNASVSSDDLKAVYLFRIANYIQWDSNEHKQNLVFCIQDNTSILSALKQIVAQVESIAIDSAASEHCDIAYFDMEPDLRLYLSMRSRWVAQKTFLSRGALSRYQSRKGPFVPR